VDYQSWLRPWSKAAILLLTLIIVGFAGKVVDYYRLNQEEAALRAQFTQEYQQFNPNASTDIVDPMAIVNSMKRSLGTATAPQVFLPSIRELATAMQQYSEAQIEAVSYRAGVVDIRVISPDVETVGNIQKALNASGRFVASIQSTDKVADRINSRIQIREAGS
jgi:type II secretory pathway component PulL